MGACVWVVAFAALFGEAKAQHRIDCLPLLWQQDSAGNFEISDFEYDAQEIRGEHSFEEQCLARGCIWNAALISDNPNSQPPCQFGEGQYRWTVTGHSDAGQDVEYFFIYNSGAAFFPFYDSVAYGYPGPLRNLKLIAHHEAPFRLRVKIEDADNQRFQVPAPYGQLASPTGDLSVDPLYTFSVQNSPFAFTIRRAGGDIIWDTDLPGQVYEDQFIQLSTKLSTTYIYGFGENMRDTWKHPFAIYRRVQMFTRNSRGSQLEGPSYGHHPFHMGLDGGATKTAYGVFFLNANAQEVDLIPEPNAAMTWRTVGGILDWYFFFGPMPEDVIKQFTSAVGLPYLVPYWSLGFQTCQWHYGSLEVINEMYERMTAAEIPWDVIQHDIDYMDRQMDFTVDPINYKGLKEWQFARKAEGFRIVVMLDPGLTFGDYEDYADLDANNCCHYDDTMPNCGVGDPNYDPQFEDCCSDDYCVKDYPSTDSGFDLDLWVKIRHYEPEADGSGFQRPDNIIGGRGNFIQLPPHGYRILKHEELFEDLQPIEVKVWPDWGNISIFNEIPDDIPFPPSCEDVDEGEYCCPNCHLFTNNYELCHGTGSWSWNHQIKYCWCPVGFPDFFMETAQQWWRDHLRHFIREMSPVDAIWIDMNEPSNGVHGDYWYRDDDYWDWQDDSTILREGGNCPNSRYDFPPYHIREFGTFNHGTFVKTICFSSVHEVHGQQELHYNVHSLYGSIYSVPTWEAVREETNTRSFVFSRSTYSGVGSYIGHWTGDNISNWEHLKYQTVGNLDFNLFGIPFVGADVCGFFEDTTEHLCMRWTQAGAYQVFWRNHNERWRRWQDPANFTSHFSQAAKNVHEKRYQLIPYIYTLYYEAHVTGSTISRSIMHEFINVDPNDRIYTEDIQFMFGSGLLISPAVTFYEQGSGDAIDRLADPDVTFYLPSGARWYDRNNGQEFEGGTENTVRVPLFWYDFGVSNSSLSREDDCKNANPPCYVFEDMIEHLRGGVIIPEQDEGRNTQETRATGFTLRMPLDDDLQATGELFWDDGESKDTIEEGEYSLIKMEAFIGDDIFSNGIYAEGLFIKFAVDRRHHTADELWITRIFVYGINPNFVRSRLFILDQKEYFELPDTRYSIYHSSNETRRDVHLIDSSYFVINLDRNVTLQKDFVIVYTDDVPVDHDAGFCPSAIGMLTFLCALFILC